MDQAESLRNIIKKQEIDAQNRTARVITVTSGKGGVGKTSFSVNLAIQLHRLGKRVVVLDADFGLANIEIMLGIRPKYNLADLMFPIQICHLIDTRTTGKKTNALRAICYYVLYTFTTKH